MIDAVILEFADLRRLNGLGERAQLATIKRSAKRVTDSKRNKADKQHASGHKSATMLERFDHEVAVVDVAAAPELDFEFSGEGENDTNLVRKLLMRMVGRLGVEPRTSGLKVRCSTS